MKKTTIIKITAIILGVIIIPLAYSLFYLSAFNDPYSMLDTLPIAVVNEDKGAVIDGSERNVGNEIVDNLKDDSSLGWRFTDASDADSGVKDTKYYAVITIPETFSGDIASAEDTDKTAPTIYYKMNEKRNYIGGQIISRAMLVLQQEVASDVNKEMTVELTKKFDEVPGKLDELNDGLGQLKDGTRQLVDGTGSLTDGTGSLKDGAQQLADGTEKLKAGTQQVADGAGSEEDALKQLASGAVTISSGTQQLADGTGSLTDGTQRLADGAGSLKVGAQQLADGTGSLKTGTQQVADGIGSLKGGSVKLADGVTQLANGMTTLADGSGSLSSNLVLYKTNFDTLVSGESLLYNGVKAKLPLLVSGIGSLDQGITSCYNGSYALSTGLSKYTAGFGQFMLGQKALADGADKNLPLLIGGIQSFNNNVNSLSVTDPATGKTYTATYADVTAQYVGGVNTLQSSYAGLVGSLQDCAATTDPAAFQQKFAAILQNLQKNQAAMQAQSQQLQAAGQQLKEGSSAICSGADSLNASVAQLQQLQQSIDQLEAAAEQLQSSAAELQKGSEDLTSGLSQAKTGADSLDGGAGALTSGDNNVADSLAKLTEALGELQAATDQLSGGAQSLNAGIQSAKSGTSQLNGQVPALESGINQLDAGAQQVNAGAEQADAGARQVNAGAEQVDAGAQQVNTGAEQANAGARQVNTGMGSLSSGLQQASDGMDQLSDGAQQVNDGEGKSSDGAKQVSEGAGQVDAGAQQLSDGAKQVDDGVKTAQDGVQSSSDDTSTQLEKLNGLDDYSANPVSLSEEKLESVPNYGTAFAPYFMSLSLWVGGLIMFFGIYLDPDKRMRILSRDSGHKLVRTAFFALISLAQAVILAFLVKWVLGLQVNNMVGYFFACVVVSLVFASIIQLFIVHMGDVGKLLAIIMLILQLTSCGGTFPMETVPKLFNILYPFMPMTYSVNLLKECISGSSSAIVAKNTLILLAIGAVFTVVTVLLSLFKKTNDSSTAAPEKA